MDVPFTAQQEPDIAASHTANDVNAAAVPRHLSAPSDDALLVPVPIAPPAPCPARILLLPTSGRVTTRPTAKVPPRSAGQAVLKDCDVQTDFSMGDANFQTKVNALEVEYDKTSTVNSYNAVSQLNDELKLVREEAAANLERLKVAETQGVDAQAQLQTSQVAASEAERKIAQLEADLKAMQRRSQVEAQTAHAEHQAILSKQLTADSMTSVNIAMGAFSDRKDESPEARSMTHVSADALIKSSGPEMLPTQPITDDTAHSKQAKLPLDNEKVRRAVPFADSSDAQLLELQAKLDKAEAAMREVTVSASVAQAQAEASVRAADDRRVQVQADLEGKLATAEAERIAAVQRAQSAERLAADTEQRLVDATKEATASAAEVGSAAASATHSPAADAAVREVTVSASVAQAQAEASVRAADDRRVQVQADLEGKLATAEAERIAAVQRAQSAERLAADTEQRLVDATKEATASAAEVGSAAAALDAAEARHTEKLSELNSKLKLADDKHSQLQLQLEQAISSALSAEVALASAEAAGRASGTQATELEAQACRVKSLEEEKLASDARIATAERASLEADRRLKEALERGAAATEDNKTAASILRATKSQHLKQLEALNSRLESAEQNRHRTENELAGMKATHEEAMHQAQNDVARAKTDMSRIRLATKQVEQILAASVASASPAIAATLVAEALQQLSGRRKDEDGEVNAIPEPQVVPPIPRVAFADDDSVQIVQTSADDVPTTALEVVRAGASMSSDLQLQSLTPSRPARCHSKITGGAAAELALALPSFTVGENVDTASCDKRRSTSRHAQDAEIQADSRISPTRPKTAAFAKAALHPVAGHKESASRRSPQRPKTAGDEKHLARDHSMLQGRSRRGSSVNTNQPARYLQSRGSSIDAAQSGDERSRPSSRGAAREVQYHRKSAPRDESIDYNQPPRYLQFRGSSTESTRQGQRARPSVDLQTSASTSTSKDKPRRTSSFPRNRLPASDTHSASTSHEATKPVSGALEPSGSKQPLGQLHMGSVKKAGAQPRRAAFLDGMEDDDGARKALSAAPLEAQTQLQGSAQHTDHEGEGQPNRTSSASESREMAIDSQPPPPPSTSGLWGQFRIPRVFAGRVMPRGLPKLRGSSKSTMGDTDSK